MTDHSTALTGGRLMEAWDGFPRILESSRTEIVEEQQQGDPPQSERRRLLEIHTISRRIRIINYRNDC